MIASRENEFGRITRMQKETGNPKYDITVTIAPNSLLLEALSENAAIESQKTGETFILMDKFQSQFCCVGNPELIQKFGKEYYNNEMAIEYPNKNISNVSAIFLSEHTTDFDRLIDGVHQYIEELKDKDQNFDDMEQDQNQEDIDKINDIDIDDDFER